MSIWVKIFSNCAQPPARLQRCKEANFSPRPAHLWHLWPCSRKSFAQFVIYKYEPLLNQTCAGYHSRICCTISIMDKLTPLIYSQRQLSGQKRICEITLVVGNESSFQLMTHPLLFLKNTPTIPLTSSHLFLPVKPFNNSFLPFSFLRRFLPFLPGKPGFRLWIDICLPFSVFTTSLAKALRSTAAECVCSYWLAPSLIRASLGLTTVGQSSTSCHRKRNAFRGALIFLQDYLGIFPKCFQIPLVLTNSVRPHQLLDGWAQLGWWPHKPIVGTVLTEDWGLRTQYWGRIYI